MKRFLAALLIAAFIVFGIWVVVFSDDMIAGLIGNSLNESGLTLEVTGIRKGLFYNFEAGRVVLKKSDRLLLAADDVSTRIDLPSLFLMKPALLFTGRSAGGRIRGSIGLFSRNNRVNIEIADAGLEGLPFFGSIGLDGSGTVSAKIRIENNAGDILFSLRDARLKTASFGSIRVPLDVFSSGRGAISMADGVTDVTSFTLEGEGVYARLRGKITGTMVNLTMELMPDRSFIETNPAFGLLAKYKDSPGHYSIPINSSVNF